MGAETVAYLEQQEAQLSQRCRTVLGLMLLNTLVSHSSSLKIIRNDTLE